MTAVFRERLADSARRGGPVILAADLPPGPDVVGRVCSILDETHPYICAVKMNLQVLLPLGAAEILHMTRHAADLGLRCIADIKLNDIGNTNAAASGILWDAGFDALIANPIMGPSALSDLAAKAHRDGRGIISLCHMSSREGAASYEMRVNGGSLYTRFLDWGLAAGVDGMVVGATFPHIIEECSRAIGGAADIVSPGVGVQGGSAGEAFACGSDYVIVGRSIVDSEDPARAARSLHDMRSPGQG